MNRLYALTVAVVATLICSAVVAQTTQRSEDELKAIVAKQPTDLAPYVELARLYAASRRQDDAEAVLRQALAVHHNSSAVYDAIASIVLGAAQSNPDKLLALAEEWLKVDPTGDRPRKFAVQGHVMMASALKDRPAEAMDHLDQAIRILDDALLAQPRDTQAHVTKMEIMRLKAEAATDPTERERLMGEVKQAQQEWAKKTGQPSMRGLLTESRQPPPAFANAVRVGGNVRAPMKTKDVKPIMPAEAVQARVQGVVILEIVIDQTGKVADARVLRSIPLLDQAALDAVRQWEFAPTEIDGAFVPVIMTATVQFMLTGGS